MVVGGLSTMEEETYRVITNNWAVSTVYLISAQVVTHTSSLAGRRNCLRGLAKVDPTQSDDCTGRQSNSNPRPAVLFNKPNIGGPRAAIKFINFALKTELLLLPKINITIYLDTQQHQWKQS